MNILISTIFWGKAYFAHFVEYSLATLLSPHNLPEAAKDHSVTLLIITERKWIEELRGTASYQQSCHTIRYEFHAFEDYGLDPGNIPGSYSAQKYQFLSTCQNIAIGLSKPYGLHIFNYADFIWSDGSLPNIISLFQKNNVFALLGFCPPVDETSIKPLLLSLKVPGDTHITIEPYRAVNLALDHLHNEAKLRNWNNDFISEAPSYLYWEMPAQGMVLRTFHPTLLAAAPSKGSKVYDRGIRHGTLDSSFSADICQHEKTMMAAHSEDIFIFSMYSTLANSKTRKNKQQVLRTFVKDQLSEYHLISFKTPLLFKRNALSNEALWQKHAEATLRDVMFVYDENNVGNACPANEPETPTAENWAHSTPSLKRFMCKRIIPIFAYYSKNILKRLLGRFR